MDLGDLNTQSLVAGLGILAVGGVGAFAVFLGSELFLNENSNVGDLVNSATQGDLEGVINNLVGDGTGEETGTEQESQAENEPQTTNESTSESNQISLSDARNAALEFVGEGQIIDSKESNLDAYSFEFIIELQDGTQENVFVSNDGSVDMQ